MNTCKVFSSTIATAKSSLSCGVLHTLPHNCTDQHVAVTRQEKLQQIPGRGKLKATNMNVNSAGFKRLRENSFASFMRKEMHSTCLTHIKYTHAVHFGEEQNVKRLHLFARKFHRGTYSSN